MTKQKIRVKYEDFFKRSLALLGIAGFDGYFKELNPAWESALGYTLAELTNRPWIEFVHPGDREAVLAEVQKLTASSGAVSFESRYRCKDGAYKWLLWRASSSIEDELCFVAAHDITRRKHMESNLCKLSRAVENSPSIVMVTDAAGLIEYVNPKFTQVAGYTFDEIRGTDATLLGQPSARNPEKEQDMWQALRADQEWRGEFLNQKKNGEVYWESASISPIKDADGKITHFVKVAEDISGRKQAAEALRESEERFRATFEQAAVGIAHVTPEGRWLRVNQRLCEIVGYSRQELRQLTFQDITHPDDLELDLHYTRRLLAGEIPTFNLEKRYIHKNGEPVWVHITISLVRKPGGEPDYTIGVVEDINWRKQAEIQLQRRDAILDAVSFTATRFLTAPAWEAEIGPVLERLGQAAGVCRVYIFKNHAAPNGAFLTSQRYEWVAPGITPQIDNPKLQNLSWRDAGFGRWLERLSRGEMIYGHIHAFPPEEQPLLAAQDIKSLLVAPIFTNGAWWGFIGFDACLNEREWSPVEVDAINTTASALGAAIRQQRIAAEMLRRNQELALLNQVIAASTATPNREPEVVLEIACQQLKQALGLSHATAGLLNETKSEFTFVAEARSENSPSLLNQSLPVPGNPALQFLLAKKTLLVAPDTQKEPRLAPMQELLQVRQIASLVMLPLIIEGEVAGSLNLGAAAPRSFTIDEISLVWSVTEQVAGALARARLAARHRQLEEQYYQAQKMEAIGQLTAGIAHDFNNLLTAMNGFAELMQMRLLANDPLRMMADKILQSGQRAADLVSRLMAFSRKQLIQPKALDLNAVVAKMDQMLARIIGEHIRLETRLAPELWPVEVDPSQIEQVIVNLAVNARDAMPEGGQLTIETANVRLDEDHMARQLQVQPGEYVVLGLSDTGLGMSEAVRAHIFEPFFTTKEAGRGTGLGLATVYGIVKQHGGSIWVDSEPGRGTAFKIYLPRSQEAALPLAHLEVSTRMPPGSETILLVEDDVGVRELVRNILQTQGYMVLETENARQALELAARYAGPIHLLLTDIVMPEMNGKVLADQLVRTRPQIKTLFMSGYSDDTISRHGVLDPGIALLPKPFSPITLAHKVRETLDKDLAIMP